MFNAVYNRLQVFCAIFTADVKVYRTRACGFDECRNSQFIHWRCANIYNIRSPLIRAWKYLIPYIITFRNVSFSIRNYCNFSLSCARAHAVSASSGGTNGSGPRLSHQVGWVRRMKISTLTTRTCASTVWQSFFPCVEILFLLVHHC